MIALMRQHMGERNRVFGLLGQTRKNPDVLENLWVMRIRVVNWVGEIPDWRVNRKSTIESMGTSKSYDGKRPKICKKRSCKGSDYEQQRKRKAPRDINEHSSTEPEILQSRTDEDPPHQQRIRKTRLTEARRDNVPEDTVQRRGAEGKPTVKPCPYYLFKEPEGGAEEYGDRQPTTEQEKEPFSVEALDGDPADKST
ncbi:hypothetical protein TNCV_1211921 [Trichonephila clavipes]|nr:hypothetical protein TNCV_1211921 [Trichonephila clavipes]